MKVVNVCYFIYKIIGYSTINLCATFISFGVVNSGITSLPDEAKNEIATSKTKDCHNKETTIVGHYDEHQHI